MFWDKKRASIRSHGNNLGLDGEDVFICWYGRRRMSWFDLRPTLNRLYSSWPPPNAVVFHLGGNDLGHYKTLDLLCRIKVDLYQLHLILPNTVLIFSEIIPRLSWFLSPDLLFLEKIRKKNNRDMAKFMPSIGGMSFRHVELEGRIPGFYRSDNVHLSDVALDILNLDLQTSVELAMARVGCQTC